MNIITANIWSGTLAQKRFQCVALCELSAVVTFFIHRKKTRYQTGCLSLIHVGCSGKTTIPVLEQGLGYHGQQHHRFTGPCRDKCIDMALVTNVALM